MGGCTPPKPWVRHHRRDGIDLLLGHQQLLFTQPRRLAGREPLAALCGSGSNLLKRPIRSVPVLARVSLVLPITSKAVLASGYELRNIE